MAVKVRNAGIATRVAPKASRTGRQTAGIVVSLGLNIFMFSSWGRLPRPITSNQNHPSQFSPHAETINLARQPTVLNIAI